MKPLYIIPARGGSKGIPRKNIKELCGRPLIAYTVDAAIEARKRLGGHILLSTDDAETAGIVKGLGIEVEYMRPAELAGDTSGSREVMLHAMDWAESQGIEYDCVVLLQPTSPFRTADDIVACTQLLEPGIDMAVSVCEAADNPYFNIFETDADGYLHISKGDGKLTRRQDAPKAWVYNGAVYAINPASLRAMPMGMFGHRVPSVMPRERSIDIDGPADWLAAETIMSRQTLIKR
mgnify:FL=1